MHLQNFLRLQDKSRTNSPTLPLWGRGASCLIRADRSTTNGITTPQRRRVYWHCAGCFGRGYGKSKSWFALWNSGPGPERHGHESLCTGGGKVCRCRRFCVRVRRERSIHRKVFSGSVNMRIIRNGAVGFVAWLGGKVMTASSQ